MRCYIYMSYASEDERILRSGNSSLREHCITLNIDTSDVTHARKVENERVRKLRSEQERELRRLQKDRVYAPIAAGEFASRRARSQ